MSEMRKVYGEADRAGYENWDQLKAFRYDLLRRQVDRDAVMRPYDTEARRDAIEASKSSVQEFHDEALEQGFGKIAVASGAHTATPTAGPGGRAAYEWDSLYTAYKAMTESNGKHPVAKQRLSAELRRFGWETHRTKSKRFALPPLRPSDERVATQV